MNTNDRKKIIFAIATTAVLISVAFGVFIYNNGSTSSIIRKKWEFWPKSNIECASDTIWKQFLIYPPK